MAALTLKTRLPRVDYLGMIESPLNAMNAIGPPVCTTVKAIQEIASIPSKGRLYFLLVF
jgi:hypothetical protein